MEPRPPGPRRHCAVLVPFIEHEGTECVLLTVRSSGLPHYSGQVSFPGGAREPRDAGLAETALRETREEVGIPPAHVELFDELDWFETGLGDRVRPFLGRVRTPCPLEPNPAEVERLLFLPVELLGEDPFRSRGIFRDRDGRDHEVHTFTFDGAEIWGLTARILRHLFAGA